MRQNLHFPLPRPRGFTLIELMITVAVVAVLAAVALPSYREYVVRGSLVDATNGLSSVRANMERFFQDNRSYNTVGTFVSPCLDATVANRTFGSFVVTCDGAPSATAFTLMATGSGSVNGFVFKITQSDVRSTTAAPTGYNTCASQWLTRKGQTCS